MFFCVCVFFCCWCTPDFWTWVWCGDCWGIDPPDPPAHGPCSWVTAKAMAMALAHDIAEAMTSGN